MRSFKILFVSIMAIAMTGCSCKTNLTNTGPGADNIGAATGEGPLKDINFGFDSYTVDATAKSILQGNAQWLKENADRRVQIEGHCDERGTSEYNMVLGANRARATMDYLRSLGIDASRLGTVSYGEDLPLDPRHNEEAWAKNRRAHFNLDVK